jgi:hypothetical protein
MCWVREGENVRYEFETDSLGMMEAFYKSLYKALKP